MRKLDTLASTFSNVSQSDDSGALFSRALSFLTYTLVTGFIGLKTLAVFVSAVWMVILVLPDRQEVVYLTLCTWAADHQHAPSVLYVQTFSPVVPPELLSCLISLSALSTNLPAGLRSMFLPWWRWITQHVLLWYWWGKSHFDLQRNLYLCI